MRARALPPELVAVLHRARDVEQEARGVERRQRAVAATTRLLLACTDAGWRIFELAPELGLNASTARARTANARARGIEAVGGLRIPPAPLRRLTRADIIRAPVDDREWLTTAEAAALTGKSAGTVARWRRVGVLPNTYWTTPGHPLYLRADLERVLREPSRWRNGATSLRTVRAVIARSPA